MTYQNLLSTPIPLFTFGSTPVALGEVALLTGAGVAANSANAIEYDVPGLHPDDTIILQSLSGAPNGLYISEAYPSARNKLRVKWYNCTSSTLYPSQVTVAILIAENRAYRQAFAISKQLSASSNPTDTWLAGIDVETGGGAIFRTVNGGRTWSPMYAYDAKAVRVFLAISDQEVLALCGEEAVVYRSTDQGETWTQGNEVSGVPQILTPAGGSPQRVCFCGAVKGGELSGNSEILVGADGWIFKSTDGGVTFDQANAVQPSVDYDQVRFILYLDDNGTGGQARYLAFLSDSTDTKAPGVVRSNDGGTTWSTPVTVGNATEVWQSALRLTFGSRIGRILCGPSGAGKLYASDNDGDSFTEVFDFKAVDGSETKVRCLLQWPDGSLFAFTQDGGMVWSSDSSGESWNQEYRLGNLDNVFEASAGAEFLLVGSGQGRIGKGPFNATVYTIGRQF